MNTESNIINAIDRLINLIALAMPPEAPVTARELNGLYLNGSIDVRITGPEPGYPKFNDEIPFD